MSLPDYLFDGWATLGRTVVVGVAAYVGLIVILRLSGKRTLSKMNAFDFVVTVALGSTLATLLLSRDVALAEGLLALGLLVALQWVVAWLQVRWPGFAKVVKSEPQLLAYRGELLEGPMRRERIVEEEIEAAVRDAGLLEVKSAEAVVLESDGTLSVVAGPPPLRS